MADRRFKEFALAKKSAGDVDPMDRRST